MRCPLDVDGARKRGVEVPDVHLAVVAPRIHVPRVGAARGREVAPDKGAQHLVAAERDDRVVVGVLVPVGLVVILPAVVVCRPPFELQPAELLRRHGHPEIPEFHALVLAVAEDIAAVVLAVNVGDALNVADEGSGFAPVAHAAPVPDLEGVSWGRNGGTSVSAPELTLITLSSEPEYRI